MRKYEKNLVLTKQGEPIFAINAMAPEGEERTQYAQTLQDAIMSAPVLTDGDHNSDEKGIRILLRWIILELELSRQSKDVGVLEMREIKDIAEDLGVHEVTEALKFFNELAVLYYYPEALPSKVFTSITPISKRLSDIVEACFTPHHYGPSSTILIKRLKKSGRLSRSLFDTLFCKLPVDEVFSKADFLSLMRYLRVLFEIDANTFLMPSLLPVEAQPSDNDYHEPLLCFWMNDGEARTLPQSYFQALIVELLRQKPDVVLNEMHEYSNSRSTFHFSVTLKIAGQKRKQRRVRLVDHVFWLEIFLDGFAPQSECCLLLKIIQSCSIRVLEQLKLAKLGQLERGLRCYSEKCKVKEPHPSECTDEDQFIFACLVKGHQWKEQNEERLFWFKGTKCKSSTIH